MPHFFVGMYLVRPSDIEINVWESLLNNMTGAAAWGWDSLFAAMKKVSDSLTIPLTAHPALETKQILANSSPLPPFHIASLPPSLFLN